MPQLLFLDHLWFTLLGPPRCPGPQPLPTEQLTPHAVLSEPHGGAEHIVLCWLALWLGSELPQGRPSVLTSDLPAGSSTPSAGPQASISVGGIYSVQNPSKKERKGSFRFNFLSHLGPPVNPKGLLTIHSHTPKDALPSPASFSLSTYYVPVTSGHWGWPTVTCPVKSKDKDGPEPLIAYLILTSEPQTPDHQWWNPWFC